MRFYLKLFAAVAIFVCGSGLPLRQTISDLAFDVRVAVVWRCGSAEQFEKLVDDTQRTLAEQRGDIECYEFGKRYETLRAERLAAAGKTHGSVSDELRAAIEQDCAREAFRDTPWARGHANARPDELAVIELRAFELGAQLD
jgi:hypothetical protein